MRLADAPDRDEVRSTRSLRCTRAATAPCGSSRRSARRPRARRLVAAIAASASDEVRRSSRPARAAPSTPRSRPRTAGRPARVDHPDTGDAALVLRVRVPADDHRASTPSKRKAIRSSGVRSVKMSTSFRGEAWQKSTSPRPSTSIAASPAARAGRRSPPRSAAPRRLERARRSTSPGLAGMSSRSALPRNQRTRSPSPRSRASALDGCSPPAQTVAADDDRSRRRGRPPRAPPRAPARLPWMS